MFPRALIILAIALLAGRCETRGYDLAVKNATSEMITDARVKFEDFDFTFGAASPGVEKTHGMVQGKVPRVIDIEWRDSAGNLKNRRVTVAAPESFPGIIRLEIQASGDVVVIAETFDERDARATAAAKQRRSESESAPR